MSTTPEQLCEFIMAKARGERVETLGTDGNWYGVVRWDEHHVYRIAPKPKKKIVLYAYVTDSMLKENLLYGHAPVFHQERDLQGFIRLPALDQEIEVEDESK